MPQSKENYRRNWLKDLVAEREGLEAKLLAVSEPCVSDIRYLGGYFPIKVNVLDRLLAMAKGAEQAEDGEGNIFCPICGVFWTHWSHDRPNPVKYGDDIHLKTCPWSPSYPEIFGPWSPDYFPD